MGRVAGGGGGGGMPGQRESSGTEKGQDWEVGGTSGVLPHCWKPNTGLLE